MSLALAARAAPATAIPVPEPGLTPAAIIAPYCASSGPSMPNSAAIPRCCSSAW
jgi:hypothetical protein